MPSWRNRLPNSPVAAVALILVPVVALALVIGVFKYRAARADAEGSAEMALKIAADPEGKIEGAARAVLDNRCVLCHSCNNAPCQLNLTSHEGVHRGLFKIPAIDPERLNAAKPTRLGIDAASLDGWRKLGFLSVLEGGNPYSTILRRTLTQKEKAHASDPARLDPLATQDSHQCPDRAAYQDFIHDRPYAGMPYNLPPLTRGESDAITAWLVIGAPPPARAVFATTAGERALITRWEKILNDQDARKRLVARYFYEHLFLAHAHFSEAPAGFFRLVRSARACGDGIEEIARRRPTDDPGGSFWYCFKPFTQTIVEKTHLPYLLDGKKLNWYERNFFAAKWEAGAWPGYDEKLAGNPFRVFAAIPPRARYQFLLEDARYHVATFIKGPVCNGSKAVSAIDEQFHVFFTNPDSDLLVKDARFREKVADLLVVPAETGSEVSLLTVAYYLERYPRLRHEYRRYRQAALRKNFPKGLGLEDLWNGGERRNPNAALTVFRHNDHAAVVRGLRGGDAPSAFVLDYALFERLVYNLTVGFDLYGDISHQFHTRVYMGMIRMEGEDNFLDFFPRQLRAPIRGTWYSSKLLGAMEKLVIASPVPDDHSARVDLGKAALVKDPENAKSAMYEAIVRGRVPFAAQPLLETPLTGLAGRALGAGAPWVAQVTDAAVVLVTGKNSIEELWTLARNKKYADVGSMFFGEELREPNLDKLILLKGLATSYPDAIYVVPRPELAEFTARMRAGGAAWRLAIQRWGRARLDVRFWETSDRMHDYLRATEGTEFGMLDYTKYDEK